VVVVGSSVGSFIRPLRSTLADRTYAETLERCLHHKGIGSAVTNSARWSMLLPEALDRFEDLVLSHQPDVVVVNFGLVDAQPRTVPLRWFRWMFARAPVQGPLRRGWRRLWGPWLARWYRRVGPILARRRLVPARVPPRQFRRDLQVLIDLVRHERGALVVLVGITPPSARVEEVLPGTLARAGSYDEVLRAAADGELDVRYLPVADLGLPVDQLAPDGIHFSAEGHRAVGEALALVIGDWWVDVSVNGLRPLLDRPQPR
jgi:lysophospholipase L1-like esterase